MQAPGVTDTATLRNNSDADAFTGGAPSGRRNETYNAAAYTEAAPRASPVSGKSSRLDYVQKPNISGHCPEHWPTCIVVMYAFDEVFIEQTNVCNSQERALVSRLPSRPLVEPRVTTGSPDFPHNHQVSLQSTRRRVSKR